MFGWFRDNARKELLAQPFPEDWEAILLRDVGHYRLLDEEERGRLRNIARVLIAEKYWEGCRGLEVTDQMKVVVAAEAALLILGLQHDYFDRVLSIILYPSMFVIPKEEEEELEEHEWDPDPEQVLSGQAVYRGPVIISWDIALEEARDPNLGRNVVIHEFAHQLDFLDGLTNGTPDLASDAQATRWHEVMTAEFEKHQHKVERGRSTFLGDYAAKDEAEFFAVAAERFFTRPGEFRRYHPRVYAVLADYFKVNPIRWFGDESMRSSEAGS